MSELLPQGSPPPVSAFSLGTMGQLVACGPVERQDGVGWHKVGRCLAPSFMPSCPAHIPETVTLIPQPFRATSPGSPSSLGLLSGLVLRAMGTLSTYPQFRATVTEASTESQTLLPDPVFRDYSCPKFLQRLGTVQRDQGHCYLSSGPRQHNTFLLPLPRTREHHLCSKHPSTVPGL